MFPIWVVLNLVTVDEGTNKASKQDPLFIKTKEGYYLVRDLLWRKVTFIKFDDEH